MIFSLVRQDRAWTRWFAWRPVRVARLTWAWLQWVERCVHMGVVSYRVPR